MKTRCIRVGTILSLLFLNAALLSAQEYSLKASASREEAIYKKGEEAVFTVSLLEDGKPSVGKKIKYELFGDGGFQKTAVADVSDKPLEIIATLDFPGWIHLKLTGLDKDGQPLKNKNNRPVFAEGGALFDPQDIRQAGEEPADFDAFWDQVRAELSVVPMRAALTEEDVPKNLKNQLRCYDLKVDCAGVAPVSGYLIIPENARPKSLPAILSLHGAGHRSAGKDFQMAMRGAIYLDINAHGILNGQKPEYYSNLARCELNDYPHFNKNDRNRIYFKGMYMRVMRALEYLKSRPEWDGKNLIIVGASQGGAQAIAGAGLDPQVTLCIATVPAMNDHQGKLAKPSRNSGWPWFYELNEKGEPNDQSIADAVKYYDGASFARRIKAEAYFSCGLADIVCVPGSVYAAFNNLPKDNPKMMSAVNWKGHGANNPKGYERLFNLLDALKKEREQPAAAPVPKS